jgi:hypothetical protein
MSDPPKDPFKGMAATAFEIHEVYSSLVNAGFLPDQALYLTAKMLTSAFNRNTPKEDDD